MAAIFARLPFVVIQDQKLQQKAIASQRKHLKRTDFCETPLTHRGAGRLRAQLRGVTVERCSDKGIEASIRGSVELTGCSLRGNKKDYYSDRDYPGTITADGRRVG